jgi:hypothetical protein
VKSRVVFFTWGVEWGKKEKGRGKAGRERNGTGFIGRRAPHWVRFGHSRIIELQVGFLTTGNMLVSWEGVDVSTPDILLLFFFFFFST